MEKTKLSQVTIERILSEGKFPAIVVEEKEGDLGSSSTTFRLDKVNAVILTRKGTQDESDHVTIKMEGNTDLQYNCDSYQEAEDFFNYVIEKW